MRARSSRFGMLILAALSSLGRSAAFAGDLNPPLGPIGPTDRIPLNARTVSFPFVINSSGSFVLTSDLVGIAGQHGIVVVADDVSIDLDGFSVIGIAGSRSGIFVSGVRRNIVVINGIIRGWGSQGLDASKSENCRLSGLVTAENEGDGLRIGSVSLVKELTSAGNAGAGILVVGHRNRIENCHVSDNGAGIRVTGLYNLIVGNSAMDNISDYDIGVDNSSGPIALVSGVGDITAVAGANHPGANFSSTCMNHEWCRDNDHDGYGDPTTGVMRCSRPTPDFVLDCADCNDANPNLSPAQEELCDGVDNDCDGTIDESNPEGGFTCGTGQPGVCATGVAICQSGSLVCQPSVSPSAELCDGLDNNCDGTVDEGVNCGAQSVCTNAACVCQTGFADCDTNPANGCEVDTLTDAAHCGNCVTACDAGEICDNGTCQSAP